MPGGLTASLASNPPSAETVQVLQQALAEHRIIVPPSSDASASATATALLASALSKDPTLISKEPPVMTPQAAALEAEKILKMAGIDMEDKESMFSSSSGSGEAGTSTSSGVVAAGSVVVGPSSGSAGTAATEGTAEALDDAGLSEAGEYWAETIDVTMKGKKNS
jgi:hypothetical protein